VTRFNLAARAGEFGLFLGRMLQAVLAVEMIEAAWLGNWWVAFIAALALSTSFLPAVLERNTRIHLPVPYQLLLTGFLFATLFLGEVSNFYWQFWWWDMALHTMSGMILGLTAFLVLFTLFDCERVHMHPILLSALAVSLAITVGTVWEFFEYAMDLSFALNMQRATLSDTSGLDDTMNDMMVNAIGATLIVGLVHLRLTRKRGRRWAKTLAQHFVAQPPHSHPHRRGRKGAE
jgi:hypothetical protein